MSRRQPQVNSDPTQYIGTEAVHALMPTLDTDLRTGRNEYYLGMIYFPHDSEIKKSDSDSTTDPQKCHALLNDPKKSDAMPDEDKRLFVNFEETLRAWQRKISDRQSQSASDVTLHFEVYDLARKHFTRLLVTINQSGVVTDIQHRDTLFDSQRETSSSAEVAVAEIVNGVFPASASNSATTASTSAQILCRYVAANLQQRNSTCADCTILSTWHDVQPVRLAELLNKLKPLGETQQEITLSHDNTRLDTTVNTLLADEIRLRAFTQSLEQECVISVYQKLGWFAQLKKEDQENLLRETVAASTAAVNEQLKRANSLVGVTACNVTAQSDHRFILAFTATITKPNSSAEQKDFSITCDVLQGANGKPTGEVKWTCNTLPWKEAYAVIAAQSFQLFKTESEKLAAEITHVQDTLNATKSNTNTAANIETLEARLQELKARQIDQRAIEIYDINDSSQRGTHMIGGARCDNVTEREAQLIQAHFDAGFTKVIYNNTTHRPSVTTAEVHAATVPQQPPTPPTPPPAVAPQSEATTTPAAPPPVAPPPASSQGEEPAGSPAATQPPTPPPKPIGEQTQTQSTATPPAVSQNKNSASPTTIQPPAASTTATQQPAATTTPPAAAPPTPPTTPTQPASTTTPPAPLQPRRQPPVAPQPIGGQPQPNEVGAMGSRPNTLKINKLWLDVDDKLDKIPLLKEEISRVEKLIETTQSFSSDASGKNLLPRIAEQPGRLEELVVKLEREVAQGQHGVKTAEKPQRNEQLLERLAVLTKTLNQREKKLKETLVESEALKNLAPAATTLQSHVVAAKPPQNKTKTNDVAQKQKRRRVEWTQSAQKKRKQTQQVVSRQVERIGGLTQRVKQLQKQSEKTGQNATPAEQADENRGPKI